jgi:predicted porin
MKPSAFVFALLGASVGSAFAQNSATVYGVLDAGVVSERGCDGCSTRVDSGVASESRIGVRGSEVLGDGLSAVYKLEAGVQLDTGRSGQDGRLFGREANVGVKGKAGTVTIGRHQNLEYVALTDVGDPFKGGTAGSATNLVGNGGRHVDNSIQYYSAEVQGVSAAASYGLGEIAGDRGANRVWGVPATAMGNNLDAKNSIIAANLRVGIATAYVAYSASRGWGSSPLWNPDNPYGAGMASTPSTDSRDVLVGVAVPVGNTTLLASYVRKNDRDLANQDANQVAFGASYALSRRTDFYAAYSRISNRNGAGYTGGNASAQGRGNAALNIGMRHAF